MVPFNSKHPFQKRFFIVLLKCFFKKCSLANQKMVLLWHRLFKTFIFKGVQYLFVKGNDFFCETQTDLKAIHPYNAEE